ncbi:hypothetical protein ACTWPT_13495 [Nonomuraea sp. 3N208]|uniref:hypothetical protein n=1 Tax=Nonomuraea sp. 3N208 TaxID=3457421 RepID=UPI003FCC32AB
MQRRRGELEALLLDRHGDQALLSAEFLRSLSLAELVDMVESLIPDLPADLTRPLAPAPPDHQLTDAEEATLLEAARPNDPQNGDHEAQLELGRRLRRLGRHDEASRWFFWASTAGFYDDGDPYEH